MREIFKRALLCSCSAIAIAHNHPLGSSEPSNEDIRITERLIEAGKILNVTVLDHFVLGEDGYTSILTHIYAKEIEENGHFRIYTNEGDESLVIPLNPQEPTKGENK